MLEVIVSSVKLSVDLIQFNSLIKEAFHESSNPRYFIFALKFEGNKQNHWILANSEFCYFKKKVN